MKKTEVIAFSGDVALCDQTVLINTQTANQAGYIQDVELDLAEIQLQQIEDEESWQMLSDHLEDLESIATQEDAAIIYFEIKSLTRRLIKLQRGSEEYNHIISQRAALLYLHSEKLSDFYGSSDYWLVQSGIHEADAEMQQLESFLEATVNQRLYLLLVEKSEYGSAAYWEQWAAEKEVREDELTAHFDVDHGVGVETMKRCAYGISRRIFRKNPLKIARRLRDKQKNVDRDSLHRIHTEQSKDLYRSINYVDLSNSWLGDRIERYEPEFSIHMIIPSQFRKAGVSRNDARMYALLEDFLEVVKVCQLYISTSYSP